MADNSDGIEAMRERMARASRKPPPVRRAPVSAGTTSPPPGPPAPMAADATAAAVDEPSAARQARTSRRRPAASGMRLAPDLPPVNLAIRVRRPLDDRLVDLIHELRGRGVRTSKVELIEMLLWELPEAPGGADNLMERLGRFRESAPRGLSSAIPGEFGR